MTVFYVYQGETYRDELEGGFVWAPQLNGRGHKNKGYTMMTFIKKGDFILHNFNGRLMAISIAQTDCFKDEKPSDKYSKGTPWDVDGYRVNTVYKELETPVKVTDHKNWLKNNYKENSAFTVDGTGKQQYMSAIDNEHAIYLLNEAITLQTDKSIIKVLKDALSDISGDKEGEYEQVEKEVIDNLVENQEGPKPRWSGVATAQEMTVSSSVERESPKRNLKNAADALARADYKCEYNTNDRIFERKSGKGYTEPHHLIPISKYRDFDYEHVSLDAMENIVSLCSHCHNLLHYGKLKDKMPILEKLYNERKDALAQVGLNISLEELTKYYK